MRVLILGYGSMGRRRAAAAYAFEHEVGVYDPRSDRDCAAEHLAAASAGDMGGSRAVGFTTEDEALAWRPDAVVISAPARDHARFIAACAERIGAPMFVEKPIARTATELDPASAHGFYIQVGCNWRFHPLVCEFKNRMALDPTEAPTKAEFWELSDAMLRTSLRRYEDALLECGSHEIDLALYLLGPAVARYARCEGTAWRVDLRHE